MEEVDDESRAGLFRASSAANRCWVCTCVCARGCVNAHVCGWVHGCVHANMRAYAYAWVRICFWCTTNNTANSEPNLSSKLLQTLALFLLELPLDSSLLRHPLRVCVCARERACVCVCACARARVYVLTGVYTPTHIYTAASIPIPTPQPRHSHTFM